MLVQRQLALPQDERAEIVSALAGLQQALAAPSPDLDALREARTAIDSRWPWLADEIESAFKQPAVTAALVRAASHYTARE